MVQIAVKKHHNKKQFEDERDFFVLNFHIIQEEIMCGGVCMPQCWNHAWSEDSLRIVSLLQFWFYRLWGCRIEWTWAYRKDRRLQAPWEFVISTETWLVKSSISYEKSIQGQLEYLNNDRAWGTPIGYYLSEVLKKKVKWRFYSKRHTKYRPIYFKFRSLFQSNLSSVAPFAFYSPHIKLPFYLTSPFF